MTGKPSVTFIPEKLKTWGSLILQKKALYIGKTRIYHVYY